MSDQGEKTCPLCAEEMDLTDQQLKPCRCGYEICVWCWHHIMDMAEKDETEGRCPACRTPYDKERIVGTAANCERLVTEINVDKKQKCQKAKNKTSESRKQLSSVRVIQRNLVYIVGLPLELADEDLLQRKEYFGQYGKVLKMSISRTSAGSIQQFANNTCSVYITYSKEEEAVRCIQSAHGFILDGRPLRACFGTTKYCHAWLRNVPCSNADCLYLHEIGSQEDSFTKDEIISAYSRSRVEQITGATNNMQRRSGNSLPPPADDYCSNSSAVMGKPALKSSSNNPASSIRGSSPPSSSCRSGSLPAAASWGARASNCNPPAGSLACSDGTPRQNAEASSGLLVLSSAVPGGLKAPLLPKDVGKKIISNEESHAKQSKNKLEMRNVSEVSSTISGAPAVKSTSESSCPVAGAGNDEDSSVPPNTSHSTDGDHSPDEDNGKIENLSFKISSVSIDKRLHGENLEVMRPNGLPLDNVLSPGSRGSQWHDSEKFLRHSISAIASKNTSALTSETEDDFDNQRLRDAIVVNQSTTPTSSPLHLLGQYRGSLQPQADPNGATNYTINSPAVKRIPDESSNGLLENFASRASGQDNSCLLLNGGHENSQPSVDMGESSIISNILSLDLDSWDHSLTSPQNLVKLLGETDKQEGPMKLASSLKGQISNQSRFSFARQESGNHMFDFGSSIGNTSQATQNHSFGQSFVENRDPYLNRLGNGFGFPHSNIELSDTLTNGQSLFPSSKLSVSRSQISAPPGFSAPSRPPPPGFPLHERSNQTFDTIPGNHLLEASSLLRNPYQASPSGNISSASDIEFIDPAILAVGKGRLPSGVNSSGLDMRPNFHLQTPVFENESRLQLLMQRSLSPSHNLRYTDVRDKFSPPNDAYGLSSRQMEQSQASNLPPFSQYSLQQTRNTVMSNGLWDGWSEIQSAANEMAIAELLRNDKLGFNKFHGGYEDSKFRMTNSEDLYNRTFRM